MITVDMNAFIKLIPSANNIYVQESETAYHLRFKSGVDDIYYKHLKGDNIENIQFIDYYLNSTNVFRVLDVGLGIVENSEEDVDDGDFYDMG